MKPVSVIVVSWNTRDYLVSCLESIRQSKPACVGEVVVVDNDSSDGSPEIVEQNYPEVTLIRAGANLGFAKGNNLAMKHARGSQFALVNSDALVHPGALETLSRYLDEHPDVGLVGPRVTGGDGLLQRSCRHHGFKSRARFIDKRNRPIFPAQRIIFAKFIRVIGLYRSGT